MRLPYVGFIAYFLGGGGGGGDLTLFGDRGRFKSGVRLRRRSFERCPFPSRRSFEVARFLSRDRLCCFSRSRSRSRGGILRSFDRRRSRSAPLSRSRTRSSFRSRSRECLRSLSRGGYSLCDGSPSRGLEWLLNRK